MLQKLLTLGFLKGRRTQIAALTIAILTFLLQAGQITQEQYNSAIGFLTAIGLLAASVHKVP